MGRPLINIAGQKFGMILVLHRVKDRFVGKTSHQEVWYRVKCDCSKKKSMRGYLIRDGRARSCGCQRRKSKHGVCGSKEYKLWGSAKGRAKQMNLPFDLEPIDIKIPEICPLLNIPIRVGKGRLTGNSPSLDRLIPKLGYVRSNVTVVSHRANQIKNDATLEELQTLTRNLEKLWASSI